MADVYTVEAIVGEAGIMAYLRHPKVLQLYGCALTAQAIWIVSELCARRASVSRERPAAVVAPTAPEASDVEAAAIALAGLRAC